MVLIQVGKVYLIEACPVASGCATIMTGTEGSKNSYIQGRSREYEDKIAKINSDFYHM